MSDPDNVVRLDLYREQRQLRCRRCGSSTFEVYAIGHRNWLWCPECDDQVCDVTFPEGE